MWTEFEWENRVNVNNSMSSVLSPCVRDIYILTLDVGLFQGSSRLFATCYESYQYVVSYSRRCDIR
jgi:hypothetical protein